MGSISDEEGKMSFWKTDPKFFMPLQGAKFKLGEELFKEQMNHLSNAIIVDDYDPNVEVDVCSINALTDLQFPDGALISGSFVMSLVAKQLCGMDHKYDDIDLYFKNKTDAE